MWGSDYPHTEGTFPFSIERIRKDFADVPEEETRKMVHDNAAARYKSRLSRKVNALAGARS